MVSEHLRRNGRLNGTIQYMYVMCALHVSLNTR